MKNYDMFYDCLFENEEFLNILYKFHSSNWDKMSPEDKKMTASMFVDKYCDILQIGTLVAQVQTSSSNKHSGYYADSKMLINCVINDDIPSYDILDTLFHELRHNYQHRAIVYNLSNLEYVDEKERKRWKINCNYSTLGVSNYISAQGPNAQYYLFQPIELDAFKAGLSLTKKSYSLIKKKLGEDPKWLDYADMNLERVLCVFSQDPYYVKLRENYEKEIFQIFKQNKKEFDKEERFINIAKYTMEKDPSQMSDSELMSMFSLYVWGYIENDTKIDLLIEFNKRLFPFVNTKIKKAGNESIKINGSEPIVYNDVMNLLNTMFTYDFKKYVDNIIDGKIQVNDKLKDDLMLNMYKDEKGQLVNFIKDSDNLLMYSVTPFGLLESKIIKPIFEKMIENERKVYGEEVHDDLKSMITFYDEREYIKFLEDFHEESFDEIYENLIRGMAENIAIDNLQRKKR